MTGKEKRCRFEGCEREMVENGVCLWCGRKQWPETMTPTAYTSWSGPKVTVWEMRGQVAEGGNSD